MFHGDSSGDEAMLGYALANDTYPSAAFMVLGDDADREYGDVEEAAEKRGRWKATGSTVFSMRDDFATIYGNDAKKGPWPSVGKI